MLVEAQWYNEGTMVKSYNDGHQRSKPCKASHTDDNNERPRYDADDDDKRRPHYDEKRLHNNNNNNNKRPRYDCDNNNK